jgi:hypothetical protein
MSLSDENRVNGFNSTHTVEFALRRHRRCHVGLTSRINTAVLSTLGRGGDLMIGVARSARDGVLRGCRKWQPLSDQRL